MLKSVKYFIVLIIISLLIPINTFCQSLQLTDFKTITGIFTDKHCNDYYINYKINSGKDRIKLTSFIMPAVMICYGLTTYDNHGFPLTDRQVYDCRNRNFSNFQTTIDDFLAPVTGITAYSLQFLGVKPKHSFKDITLIFATTAVVNIGITESLKRIIHRQRPDNSNNLSFPSAHTSIAFAGADLLHQEYGEKSILYSIGGYTIASSVGIMRILNNEHWFSDVVVGAGIGILSSRLSYLAYENIFYKKTNSGNKFKLFLSTDIPNRGFKISLTSLVY